VYWGSNLEGEIASELSFIGGASKNRTCDLSIISSFQGDDLEDIKRRATF
jgi:hypothetical protein